MAELVYDETGRLLFTEEMKKEYTILVPQMLPMHFAMLVRIMQTMGYNVEMLNTTGKSILDYGQKYVHNDACFPAILVIGQLIDAVKSGKYDPHKVALVPLMDELGEDARLYGAVNTVCIRGKRCIGHNTDGMGFYQALTDLGVEVPGRRITLLGAGARPRLWP